MLKGWPGTDQTTIDIYQLLTRSQLWTPLQLSASQPWVAPPQ